MQLLIKLLFVDKITFSKYKVVNLYMSSFIPLTNTSSVSTMHHSWWVKCFCNKMVS